MSLAPPTSEINAESELLAPLGPFGDRKAERRRLQAALIPLIVVDVEDVEHLPERRRGVPSAKAKDLADAQVDVPLGVAAP